MLRTMTDVKSFRGQTDGSYKTQTFMGQDYYVVPVVAMVEGVRFGANQSSAELGLASEFGKFVEGWNNSPIVLGHPQVDGKFVSASSPSVLETYQIGLMMGTRVEEKKLKCEAWIALSRRDHSDESKSVFERVEANEMIEVSVGFFTDLEDKSGKLNGQEYSGIWRNVVPDHLAFLAEGVLGACSIEDGCGTPRVNHNKKDKKMFRTDKSKKKAKKDQKTVSKYMNEGEDTNCSCHGASPATQAGAEVVLETPKEIRDMSALVQSIAEYSEKDAEIVASLVAQVAPENMLSSDVYALLSSAVNDAAGHSYAYLYGFTTTHAIYQMYSDGDWYMNRQAYSISDDGVVTLTGEPEEVRLITKIVPVEAAGDGITANEISTQENTMTTPTPTTTPAAETNPAAVTPTPTTTETTATPTPTTTAEPKVESAPKVLSEAEYIANAPAGVREVLEASMKVHAEQKAGLITKIKANERNTFSDEFLNKQDLDTLKGFAALANVTVDYSGIAAPTSRAQAAADEDKVAPAPKALSRKVEA